MSEFLYYRALYIEIYDVIHPLLGISLHKTVSSLTEYKVQKCTLVAAAQGPDEDGGQRGILQHLRVLTVCSAGFPATPPKIKESVPDIFLRLWLLVSYVGIFFLIYQKIQDDYIIIIPKERFVVNASKVCTEMFTVFSQI